MKIEKVNENQIRCTLSKKDLADRQIKLSELAYGSEKAKGLFRDMIEQANYEFGFEADDIPLMIEAIPLSGENIILQITKVEYPEELDTRFSKFSEMEEEEEEVTGESSILPELQGEKLDVLSNLTKLFEFKNLEQVERLAQVLGGFYEGENDLYKDELKNRLYLLVQKSSHTPEEFNKVCNVISEYAVHRKYVPAKEAFLKEHGKLLVKGNALQILENI
ncbi:MAG: adaptor protein MecA [Agathobacter sp.]|nr:adaptor protein MecA [Agathobacter sp.]